jgi:hypothetical protein
MLLCIAGMRGAPKKIWQHAVAAHCQTFSNEFYKRNSLEILIFLFYGQNLMPRVSETRLLLSLTSALMLGS